MAGAHDGGLEAVILSREPNPQAIDLWRNSLGPNTTWFAGNKRQKDSQLKTPEGWAVAVLNNEIEICWLEYLIWAANKRRRVQMA